MSFKSRVQRTVFEKIQYHVLNFQSRRFNGDLAWKKDRARLRTLFSSVQRNPLVCECFEDYARVYEISVKLRAKGCSDFIPRLQVLPPYLFISKEELDLQKQREDAMEAYIDMYVRDGLI